ncbi:MAG: hypothetical protein B7Z66_14820 [Chromatiales bacterium 21-64-14]|nr:MAG: hypothetical protein B7Z66_14820 [Chromatiales bacterium 21-64-14]
MRMRSIVRRLRTVGRILVGRDLLVRRDVRVRKERFGSEYGGWDLAIEHLVRDPVIYSFGVGEDISFERALIDRFKLTVHAFDPTPKSIKWIMSQKLPDGFIMHQYGIAATDGMLQFNPPENPAHVSYTLTDRPSADGATISAPVKRLATVMRELGHTHIDVLKMDIEGAEYEVIGDLVASKIFPAQLLVEFHHRLPNIGSGRTKDAIEMLRQTGYLLFSISPTNEEFAFILRTS